MRILIRKSDNRILEAQPGKGKLNVLLKNAKAAGLAAKEVEAKEIPDQEYQKLLAAQLDSETTYKERRKADYPKIGEQLDALYHAGAFPPEMAKRIAAVKAAHPKTL
jgi:hypothetical protein